MTGYLGLYHRRAQSTLAQLGARPGWFDRLTKDKTGGRVAWRAMPLGYDNKSGLAWREVRGRYWYPWRNKAAL